MFSSSVWSCLIPPAPQGEETGGGEGGRGRVGDPEGGQALRLRAHRLRVRHHRPAGHAEEAEEDEEGGAQEE